MTISLAQITALRQELAAAAVALDSLRGAVLRISSQIDVLDADDLKQPLTGPPVARYEPGMGWTP